MRERPVASEKIAVDQASRRPRASTAPVEPRASTTEASIGRGLAGAGRLRKALWYHRRARGSGHSHEMPNIKQQKKRVRIAAEERLQNLRYRSTVKTLTRRLRAAVEDGDAERVAAEHLRLVRSIDKAAARGALHRNTAARRKAQAAKLVGRA